MSICKEIVAGNLKKPLGFGMWILNNFAQQWTFYIFTIN